jgi:streptogramin lyase
MKSLWQPGFRGLVAVAVSALPAAASGKGGAGIKQELKAALEATDSDRGDAKAGAFDITKIPGIRIGPMGTGKTEPVKRSLAADAGDSKGGPQLREIRTPVKPGKYGSGLHPFFKVSSMDEVGKVAYFMGATPGSQERPHNLLSRADGWLFWLAGQSKVIHGLSPTKGQHPFPVEGNSRLNALLPDPEHAFAFFGDRTFGHLAWVAEGSTDDGSRLGYRFGDRTMRNGPRVAAAGANGDVWGASDDKVFHIPHQAAKANVVSDGTMTEPSAMVFDPEGGAVYWVSPRQDRVGRLRPGGKIEWLELEGKSCPQGIALGPDRRLWVTLPGSERIGLIDLASGQTEYLDLAEATGRGPLGPHGIALGPDNNLWVTLKSAGQICRITPQGVPRRWALPFGNRPQDIVRGHDGRMLFTLADHGCIGAITALPQSLPSYPGLAPEPAVAPASAAAGTRTARAPKKLSRAERNRLHDAWVKRAEERERAREAETGLPEAEAAEPVAEAKEEQEEALPAAAPSSAPAAPLSPDQRLARLKVYLTANRARHIFHHHAHGRYLEKSQFAESCNTLEKVKELLAQGMEAAARHDLIGRVVDGDHAHITYCDLPEVIGNHSDWGWFTPTRRLKVVTARHPNLDDNVHEHYVITAYPDLAPE